MRADIQAMGSNPAPDQPVQTINTVTLSVNGFANTPDYLFGVEHSLFSMKNRWNQIAANPRAAAALPEVDEQVGWRCLLQGGLQLRQVAQESLSVPSAEQDA